MRRAARPFGALLGAVVSASACAGAGAASSPRAGGADVGGHDVAHGVMRGVEAPAGAIAQIYYWRARPGKLEEYNRYIRDVAEPIDAAARERGAFLSVTTYVARDTTVPWTHMRIFILRDSTQLAALGAALDEAGARLEPDSVKRRLRGEYAATLRDRVGQATVDVLP